MGIADYIYAMIPPAMLLLCFVYFPEQTVLFISFGTIIFVIVIGLIKLIIKILKK